MHQNKGIKKREYEEKIIKGVFYFLRREEEELEEKQKHEKDIPLINNDK